MSDLGSSRVLAFRKMHGLGNDFVVVDARNGDNPVTPDVARALGDRHRGVGCDQIAVVVADAQADAGIEFWNSDGTQAGACGNATRCVARILMDESGADRVKLRTRRGILTAIAAEGGMVTVNMGQPELVWDQVPVSRDVDLINLPIEGSPAAVGMGNPHMIFAVPDVEAIALEQVGPGLEHHPLFPEATNVEFCEVNDPKSVVMRVWERGAGRTLACGSGACAAAVALHRKGLTERRVTITLDGGPLMIDWRDDGVWMTGPVAHVFDGRFVLDAG